MARTSLAISALNHNCCKILLNLRHCAVTSVRVNTLPCAFELVSPLDDDELVQRVSSVNSRAQISGIESAMNFRSDESFNSAELVINLPTKITADVVEELDRIYEKVSKSDKKPDETLGPDSPPPVPIYELPILHVDIEYNVLDPTTGAVFYGDQSNENDIRDPVYMLTDSRFGMARFWMPCVDSAHWCDRYLFDFDISVDPSLCVVASGELVDTVLYPNDNSPTPNTQTISKMYKYRSHVPAHASEIVVAVGPFIPLPDPVLTSTVTHFCLPGHVRELVHTGPPLFAKALAFCRDYFGSDPPSCSFKQLFLGSTGMTANVSVSGAGGIVVHSGDLLHTERNIDEGFVAREAVMNGLVSQYCGRFLCPRSSEDGWLISGLSLHVATLGLGLILGRNWYKFRIHDTMDAVRKDISCFLSTANVNQLSGSALESVHRRSHIIIYMIERKIGGDVLKRALRDIIAEGKRAIMVHVKAANRAIQRPVYVDDIGKKFISAPLVYTDRELSDLNGISFLQNAPTGSLLSGFDEAVQGVGVGPFLKRLRAICGSDVRSMVRTWASSPGIPRMHVGYQYNPRKHTIEFVIKQELPSSGRSGQNLLFHGSISIRVMEAEGAYDHSLDISEPIFATEVHCHSRRTKAVKGGVPEAVSANSVTEASPLSWIRFDPENELCKELTYKQHESSWGAVVEGERDVIGQLEGIRGLRGFICETSGKTLLSILKDNQAYWRVRAEAAIVLASSEEGLAMLISYFRSCYVDGNDEDSGHLRSNNFSNIANYFVKRAMIRAVAGARTRGSCTESRPEGSIPLEASQFLYFLLSGHDNSGNGFEDDHYLIELLDCISQVAITCIGDSAHDATAERSISTTDSIVRLLERFRSMERMIHRKSKSVAASLIKALCSIERARMTHRDRTERGSVSSSLRKGIYPVNSSLLESLFELTRPSCSMDCRLTAMTCLLSMYGGHPEVLTWALAYVDRTKSGCDILSLRHKVVTECGKNSSGGCEDTRERRKLCATKYGYSESAVFRHKLLGVFTEVGKQRDWFHTVGPAFILLRQHDEEAVEVCTRLLRLIVADGDPRVRSSALSLAKAVWRTGVPTCLLSHREYMEAKSKPGFGDNLAEIVPIKSHRASCGEKLDAKQVGSGRKSVKSSKSKSSKNGKISKSRDKSGVVPKVSADLPPRPPKSSRMTSPIIPIDVDVPVLSTEARVRSNRLSSPLSSSGPISPKLRSKPMPQSAPATNESFDAPLPILPMPRSMLTESPNKRKPLGGGARIQLRSQPLHSIDMGSIPTPMLSSKPLSLKGRGQKRQRAEDEPHTQEANDTGAVEGTLGKNGCMSDKKQGVFIPRSKPVIEGFNPNGCSPSVSKKPMLGRDGDMANRFEWHPLDEEDQRMLVECWRRERNHRAEQSGDNSIEIVGVGKGVRNRVEGHSGGFVDEDGVLVLENGKDGEELEGNSVGGKDEKKKKSKKKKKRKKEGNEGDDEERRRKKKKKKKKKQREKEWDEVDRAGERGSLKGDVGVNGEGSSEGGKKIGKIQIRLPSRSASHVSLSD